MIQLSIADFFEGMMKPTAKRAQMSYPSDVSDDEWAFVAPYLALLPEHSAPRTYPLREVFNAARYIARSGAPWRYLPNDFPPWPAVYQQTQRWLQAGVFEQMIADARVVLRVAQQRQAQPTAAIYDSRTVPSTPESGARAGYDGAKKRRGAKVHIAVDTLGHLLALVVTAANEQDRAQVKELSEQVQYATDEQVDIAFVDQAYTGEQAAADAQAHGIELMVVKHSEPKRGFVLLPKRWVVERSFGWAARFRRLARDYERLAQTLVGFHVMVFVCVMLAQWVKLSS